MGKKRAAAQRWSLHQQHQLTLTRSALRPARLTFVFLQSLLCGLEHRLVELLGEFLWGEAVPGFGAPIDGVKALFSLQGERGPQAVQQAGALLGD